MTMNWQAHASARTSQAGPVNGVTGRLPVRVLVTNSPLRRISYASNSYSHN
jgi:hypothetical protein